jgi:competence protein ComGC
MNQRINRVRHSKGFTLIELMLSMGFVSVLLVTIALTVIQMATIYNRGMTLKEVNQSARDISDDLRRSVASSQLFTVNTDGTDSSDSLTIKTASTTVGGRLCTGTVSYVWNLSKAIEGSDANLTKVLNSSGVAQDPVRFVKIPDNGKKYCAKSGPALTYKNILYADSLVMTDLLDAGDHKLGLHALTISTADSTFDVATGQRLYSVTYVIGSGETSAMRYPVAGDPVGTPIRCYAPGELNPSGVDTSNVTYCNVQQFTIVLRVGNTVN